MTLTTPAVFDSNERYAQPDGLHHGKLHFDTKSIRIFDPIDAKTMRDIWATDFSYRPEVEDDVINVVALMGGGRDDSIFTERNG